MELTKEMREEVASSLTEKVRSLDRVRDIMARELAHVTELRKQSVCPHENIKVEGGYMYDYITCTDCRYQWTQP